MKNTLILTGLVIALFIWFPTFGPADIISFGLMAKLGMQTYIFYSIIILIVAYFLIDGKGISDKINTIKQELRRLI